MNKITVSKDQKPFPHDFYGDSYERGLDPFHKDAAPDEFKDSHAFSGGKRKEGWFLVDAWGNRQFSEAGRFKKGVMKMNNFKWFEGDFPTRLIQFCCYVAAALAVMAVFHFVGSLICGIGLYCE